MCVRKAQGWRWSWHTPDLRAAQHLLIDYFRIPHDTLCLPPKFCISYCLQMLLGKCSTPRSISKQWFMQNLGGAIRVYYREYPHPQGMTRHAKTPQLSGECMGPPPIDWCIMTEPRDLRRHCQRLSANSKKCHSFLQRIAGFHMTSLKFKPQNYRSYRDFTFMMY